MLPTFVISALGFNVRVAAVISHLRLRVPATASTSLSPSSFFVVLLTPDPPFLSADRSGASSSAEAGSSLRVCHRGSVHREYSCDKTVEGYPTPPPTPPSLSPANARVCACDARCRASIGRRLCPLFIIKGERRGERLPLRVRPIYIFSWNLIAHSDANIQPRRGKNQSCCY